MDTRSELVKAEAIKIRQCARVAGIKRAAFNLMPIPDEQKTPRFLLERIIWQQLNVPLPDSDPGARSFSFGLGPRT